MVSPERVIAYGGLEVEASLETLPPFSKPPPNWPDKGNIVLNDLCYSHSVDGPQVLTNISCVVSNRSKVINNYNSCTCYITYIRLVLWVELVLERPRWYQHCLD